MKLFTVQFTFNDSYSPKEEGFTTISMVVSAQDQFIALTTAWTRLSSLGLADPKSFNVSKVSRD